ncbi:rRNA maturation RNase YbeY [Palleronia sp. LCG004]|uniref:rRNA maturation RNase YbeY n=1 Tax=Palleronia sp. LCG004 TaxID=3079304 RepID=UPI002942733E|nr:rRNA maturation RNase YbeY [Palleronia sp. LCG004]WOI57400.1 rRNA maturation RNase YbeY [Palleronia sp. LCG004]
MPDTSIDQPVVDLAIEDERWSSCPLERIASRASITTFEHLGLGADWEIAILACDDARIAVLNGDFRGKDLPTNVLSWPSVERSGHDEGATPRAPDPADPELGDIAIAYDTCAAEAEAAGIPFEDHVAHLIVHAVLHLLGYDHERPLDGDLMEALEGKILARMGIPDPYARDRASIEASLTGKAR